MDYALAKQLKDAGYVSKANFKEYARMFCPHDIKPLEDIGHITRCPDAFYFPHLSELIEACPEYIVDERGMNGECIFSLSHWNVGDHNGETTGTWTAMYDTCDYQPLIEGEGKTPEHAVAKLWLALQSK